MSDKEIRRMLAERKNKEKAEKRKEDLRETIEGAVGWSGLLFMAFMAFAIGG